MKRQPTPIQQAIRQSKPFRNAGHAALVALARTADVIRRRYDAMLAPYELTAQQYNVLRILRGAGPKGIPTLAIAERMVEQSPGITRLLDRLEKRGWVRRERCVADRRQVLCYATPASLTLLTRLDKPIERLDAAVVEEIPEAELETLVRLLDQVRAGAE